MVADLAGDCDVDLSILAHQFGGGGHAAAAGFAIAEAKRAPAERLAEILGDRLERNFGEANVFIDVDRLLAGQRFDRELSKALEQCDVLIAVIGPRWMELLAEHAGDSKRDYVHDEIVAALKRDIVVVPVLVGREGHMPSLPSARKFPAKWRSVWWRSC